MFIEERQQLILEHLKKEGRISANQIQDMFDVSFDTARRDLRKMEEKGLLKRTHGGALPVRQIGSSKPPKMTGKDIEQAYDNYDAIAKKATSMIEERDVIFITSASIGYLMTKYLPKNFFFTVVTNSIVIAEETRKMDNIRTIVVGGEMDNKGNFYDAMAVEALKRIKLDKCFITSACLSAEFGLSIQRTAAIALWNVLIEHSKKVIGLYPTEKIGFDSIISICPADKLDVLLTDWEASEDEMRKFDEKNINIIIVDLDEQGNKVKDDIEEKIEKEEL